ncbi:MAG: hypothetical protein K6G73_07665 [Marinilabiliaceae bacterium]|nr:hypothetical protein [Marinilabiliaceae bacterium]
MRTILSLSLLLIVTIASAQPRGAFEGRYYQIDTTAIEGDVDINIDVATFFRNNEYFSAYVEGYTLPGYTLQPTLAYFPTKNSNVEAGLRLRQYGGDDDKLSVFPIVRAQLLFTPRARLTIGVLDGYASHDLPESIIDIEKELNGRPETGIQFVYSNDRLWLDTWIDWQKFIYHGDTVPERFMAGIGVNYAILTNEKRLRLELPFRMTANHVGGQINNYAEPMQSLLNGVLGVRLKRQPNTLVKAWQCDIRGQFFHVAAGKSVYPAADGSAFNAELMAQTSHVEATIGYFRGNNFFAMHGNPTYMCISNFKEYYSKERSIVTGELNVNYRASDAFRFYIGGKAYYDTEAKQCDYYYGLGIVFDATKNIYRRK